MTHQWPMRSGTRWHCHSQDPEGCWMLIFVQNSSRRMIGTIKKKPTFEEFDSIFRAISIVHSKYSLGPHTEQRHQV